MSFVFDEIRVIDAGVCSYGVFCNACHIYIYTREVARYIWVSRCASYSARLNGSVYDAANSLAKIYRESFESRLEYIGVIFFCLRAEFSTRLQEVSMWNLLKKQSWSLSLLMELKLYISRVERNGGETGCS